MFNPEEPYNELPDIPPDERYWRTLSVLEEAAVRANRALAELKGRLSVIPNPRIFINTLALQEAKDSSSIENIFTTNDELFRAFTVESVADPHTKEVLRYGKALTDAFETIKSGHKFSIPLMESIYRNITDENDGVRDVEVYVGRNGMRVYTPPCCRDVITKKLENWASLANSRESEMDPLVMMAILHYQFEAIHPFRDGNGRTGRILNVLLLSAHGLLDEPVLYLSKYINVNKNEYYRLLREVTEEHEWEEWIVFMLKAVEKTSKDTLRKVNAISELFEKTKEKIRNEASNIYSFELVEVLFTQVYCKYSFLTRRGIVSSRNTASKYLNRLEKLGILEKERIGREVVFRNRRLYKLLKEE